MRGHGVAEREREVAAEPGDDALARGGLAPDHALVGSEAVARQVQERVSEYLARTADLDVGVVDVVVESFGAAPAKQ